MAEHHSFGGDGHAVDTSQRWIQPDREKIKRARQTAEALFTPKAPVIEQSAPTATPTADQTARRPRILSAVPVQPTRVEPTETPIAAVSPKPIAKIPASHRDRIRTWLKYGMTMRQIAEVYGVTIGDIERMLQRG